MGNVETRGNSKTTSARGGPRRARPMTEVPGTTTRQKMMDAAETLFAERGFSGVSLREILSSCGLNVAAANYHFGTKEVLFEHVFRRCALPVSNELVRKLDALENRLSDGDIVEQVVTAMIAPSFGGGEIGQQQLANFNLMRAHLFLEQRSFAEGIFNDVFQEPARKSVALISRVMPELEREDVAWRMHIILGALVFTSVPSGRFHPLFQSAAYHPERGDEAVRHLVPLLASIFRK